MADFGDNNVKNSRKKYISNPYIHIILFLATFISATLAGVNWAGKLFLELENFHLGITYGILIISFLTAHEFGHYFAARYHGVKATLPYYIPFPPTIYFPSLFGTFGAVIKTKTPIMTRKALFDIGVAGPIAGFIFALSFLIFGLVTLPSIEFIYNIHPEYLALNNGQIPVTSLHFGDTLLYFILSNTIANPDGFLPPMNEIYHYPFLNVGWFGLFVTSLNMMPMGQLDGGHITYAMFGGRIQKLIANIFWWIIMIIGIFATIGLIHDILKLIPEDSFFYFFNTLLFKPLDFINNAFPWLFKGWPGWLFWGLITKYFIKLPHPPVIENDELSSNRKIVGWISYAILILSFSINGIYIIE